MSSEIAVIGRVVTPFQVIDDGMVVIQGQRITEVGTREPERMKSMNTVLDWKEHYIIPGFIDMLLTTYNVRILTVSSVRGLTENMAANL